MFRAHFLTSYWYLAEEKFSVQRLMHRSPNTINFPQMFCLKCQFENFARIYIILLFTHFYALLDKTLLDHKGLPWKHLISCWGVKLFLTKDFCQKLFFCFNRIWVFFSFVTIRVFEFCYNFCSWVFSQLEFWSFFSQW